MHWFKRNLQKMGIIVAAGLFLAWAVWMSFSVLGIQAGRAPAINTGVARATPTVDTTAVAQDQAKQQDEKYQRENSGLWPFWLSISGSVGTILLAVAAFASALIGIRQWFGNRQDEQEKRSEARFQTVATGLGSERKEARIAAAIILRTFLRAGYDQFHRQAFDLAVAYLQPLGINTAETDFVPLDPLRQALITVFQESFLRVRGEWKEQKPGSDSSDLNRLGAVGVLLDGAYLAEADLRGVWMREALLRKAHLSRTDLTGAHLKGADFTEAYLGNAILIRTDCSRAIFTRAKLKEADFAGADISRADFTGADLTRANPEAAALLKDTKMSSVVGLTPEQRDACVKAGASFETPLRIPTASIVKRWSVFSRRKAQSVLAFLQKLLHAAVKELLAASASFDSSNQSTASDKNSSSSLSPSQSSDVQAPSAAPAQGSPPTPATGGSSSATFSQPSAGL